MKIAILTGGGDCPGMNAFVRSAVRSALHVLPDSRVFGVLDGWVGLLEPKYRPLTNIDTAGINRLGGTILGTMRAPELAHNRELQDRLVRNFLEAGFDALLVCGGNGSLRAASTLDRLLRENGSERSILFTPASIDNDVANTLGTALGFYSALTRSLEMMEWIRDTASAHRRVYLIGSMGRSSAYLPFYAGIASGAEYVIRPSERVNFEAIADMVEARDRDTRIIVSEAYPKSLESIRAILSDSLERRDSRHEIRTVDMGYFQRGGEATVADVIRANWIAFHMVQCIREQAGSGFFGAFHVGGPPNRVPLEDALKPSANHDDIPRQMIEMALALR
ncbi:MAG TPA: 6-phosphofructokinase [Candidatus Kapabacteria bacterium]|nr:6-phosphofructokinase [Candidatus Kapabacteria bacterium]